MTNEKDRIKQLGYSAYEAKLICDAGLLIANVSLQNTHDSITAVLAVLENLSRPK